MSQSELTMLHKLREVRDKHPNREVFVSYNEETGRQAITFSEFHTLCCRFAYILKEEGVKAGDYVTVTLPVSIETAVVTLAVVVAGAVPVSLDITFKNGEGFMQCIEKVKSSLVIIRDEADDNVVNFFKDGLSFSKGVIDTAGLTWARLPHLTKAYLVKRGGNNDFLTKLREAKGEYEYEKLDGKMSAFMHFTTGTVTDYLKLTEMTHESAVRYCESMHSVFIKPYKKILYINGWYWVTSMPYDIFYGVTRCIPDNWVKHENFPRLLYRFIQTEDIRFADLQPIYMGGIMKLWREEHPGGKPLLDLLTVLGMPITRRMLQRYASLTNTFNLIYGSHECGANHNHIVEASQVDQFTDFDCGSPMPAVKTKIVDENWQPVPLGEKGRLLLKTPGMFRGYPNQPDRTAACFDKEGWFMTRDRACYHKDTKHLMVGGRIDSIILHGEYMVYPTWIEDMVSPHPSVKQVISVPVADDVLFHAIGVCVIKKSGCDISQEDVTNELGKYLFPDKIYIFHVKHLLFFEKFPLQSDGTVDRSRLFDLVNEMTRK